MSYTYINFEPTRTKITDNMKYFCVAKDYAYPIPKGGKKKCTSEQIKEYNDVMKRRDETFKRLQVGNIIDMGNRYLVMKDIKDEISWNWNEKDYIYKIEPINCEKHSERYSDEEVRVSSFQVVKRIETIPELLDDVSKTFYYGDIFNEMFYSFRYKKSREDGLKFFEYFTTKYPDKKIYLSDILYQELHSYKKDSKYKFDDTDAKEYAEELYNKGAYGDKRLHQMIINLFGEDAWNEALEGTGYKQAIDSFMGKIKQLNGTFYQMFASLPQNNIWSVDSNGSIVTNLDGITSTQQLIDEFAKLAKVSTETAEAAIADLQTYSSDLSLKLQQIDYAGGMEDLLKSNFKCRTVSFYGDEIYAMRESFYTENRCFVFG